MAIIAGLDVGGAHLKVAIVEDGRPVQVEQILCPLWQGMDKLEAALAAVRPMATGADMFAVTMTGELSDLFESRQAGVEALARRIGAEFGPNVRFWAGRRGFGDAAYTIRHHTDVGSTNFLATAAVVANRCRTALLVDFGSTTADVIPIVDRTPCPSGLNDAVRQTTGELVYTGATRTAVMGVTQRAPFKGTWVELAREYLATMADVRRILGQLDDGIDLHATADGRGKTLAESVARLARMLGREAADGGLADWQQTARYIAECQLRAIHDGVLLALSRNPDLADGKLVGAGIGADVALTIGERVGLETTTFGALIGAPDACRQSATHSAPAVAVAMLLAEEPG
ncbi:MAG: hypothetical protein KDJ37_09335 [Hyphomicrobiaceae bacterium]|nr:hypothetical protein [Hyphomicrobiaceae bacterium]